MELLHNVASIDTTECPLLNGIGSTGDKYTLCVDFLSCVQAAERFDLENHLVLIILELHSCYKTKQKDVIIF